MFYNVLWGFSIDPPWLRHGSKLLNTYEELPQRMEKIHHLEYILVLVNIQIAFAEQTFTTKEGTNNRIRGTNHNYRRQQKFSPSKKS
jgi:hypothetical protein